MTARMNDYIIEHIDDLTKRQRIMVLSLLKSCKVKIDEKGDGTCINLDNLNLEIVELIYSYVRHCKKRNRADVKYILEAFGS